MTIVALPAIGLSDLKWTPPAPRAQRNRSEFNDSTQVVELRGGGRWQAEASLVRVRVEKNILPWRAFAAQLRGIVNEFRLVAVEGPQQVNFGARPVSRAPIAPGGRQVAVSGLQPNSVQLLPGQLMTVPLIGGDEQLVTIVAPMRADAAGNATAEIGELLRKPVGAGVAIEINRPWALMRMIDGDQLAWAVSPGQSYAVGFKCEEAF